MQDAEQFETYSNWLDDGWLTEPGPVRDGDAGITLIREEDLVEIERELGKETLVPWTFDAFIAKVQAHRPQGSPCRARPGTVDYCVKEGASWHKPMIGLATLRSRHGLLGR